MRIFPLFDHDKKLFLPYLLSNLSKEIEIWFVCLVEILHVLFQHLDFSALFHPLLAPKIQFFLVDFFTFFEFVPSITRLQIDQIRTADPYAYHTNASALANPHSRTLVPKQKYRTTLTVHKLGIRNAANFSISFFIDKFKNVDRVIVIMRKFTLQDFF